MKTQTYTMHPILACLSKAEDFLGKDRKWKPSKDSNNKKHQKEFIEYILPAISDIDKIGEIKSIADLDVSKINAFLKEEGFDIELSDIPKGEGFAVASVMKVLVEWTKKGKSVDIFAKNKKKYDGIRVDANNVHYYKSQLHSEPVASPDIKKSGDSFFITKIDDAVVDSIKSGKFEIFDWIKKVRRGLLTEASYSHMDFPCVDHEEEVDISWLVGMNTSSDKNSPFKGVLMEISEAKQQTKFRMNEVGAKVESAVALGMMRCLAAVPSKKPLIIDGPFLLWIERSQVSLPYFAGIFNYEAWKKPANLD